MKKNKIISPYLTIQNFHINMFFSILNRICGIVLIFYVLYLFTFVGAVFHGYELYYSMLDFFNSEFGKIINIIGIFSFIYHFLSSMKYISFTKGNFQSIKQMNLFSMINFLISLLFAMYMVL